MYFLTEICFFLLILTPADKKMWRVLVYLRDWADETTDYVKKLSIFKFKHIFNLKKARNFKPSKMRVLVSVVNEHTCLPAVIVLKCSTYEDSSCSTCISECRQTHTVHPYVCLFVCLLVVQLQTFNCCDYKENSSQTIMLITTLTCCLSVSESLWTQTQTHLGDLRDFHKQCFHKR